MVNPVSGTPQIQSQAAPRKPAAEPVSFPATASSFSLSDTVQSPSVRKDFVGPPVSFSHPPDDGQDFESQPDPRFEKTGTKKFDLSTDASFIAPGASLKFDASFKKQKVEEALRMGIPLSERKRDYRATVTLRIPLGGE